MGIQNEPDARDLRYLKLVSGRASGLSDEEIAQQVDGVASPRDLYEQIKEDGHPICPKCGTTYVDDTHCAPPEVTTEDMGRQARGSGPVKELPPAGDAAPLFREKLEELIRTTKDLKHRKEKLQGNRFIQSAVYRDPVFLSRGLLSDEQWQYTRDFLGLDPEAKDHLYFGGATFGLGGGTPAPQDPLPALIGAHLLAGGEVQPLLDLLYPGPPSAEVEEKIRRRVEGRKGADKQDGLKVLAQQLATLVRGGEVGKGRNRAELSGKEINLACRITERREAGIPDEKIYEELLGGLGLCEEQFSWDEFCRLAKLRQKWPWA